MRGLDGPDNRDIELLNTWSDRPGFIGWLTTVDHKRIANAIRPASAKNTSAVAM